MIEIERMEPRKPTGQACCVPGCGHNTLKDRHLSWHSFPKDAEHRKEWLRRINRRGVIGKFSWWEPSKHHKVCGAHFNASGRRAYMDHLPTIFPHRVFSERWLPEREVSTRQTNAVPNSQAQFQSELVICSNVEPSSVTSEGLLLQGGQLMPPATMGPDSLGFEKTAPGTQCTAGPDHTYVVPGSAEEAASHNRSNIESLLEECEKLSKENECLLRENAVLKEEVQNLKNQLHDEKVSRVLERQQLQPCKESRLDELLKDEKRLRFYTGFSSAQRLNMFVNFIEQKYKSEKTNFGRPTILPLKDQLFVVLCRLRVGLLEQDLAYRLNVSVSTISVVFTYWVNFLHDVLIQIPIWPARATIDKYMPLSFKDMYPSTRIIIDCTELFIEVPSDYRNQSDTYSSYKSHNTAKGLIGITPNGLISLVSDLAPGRVSDKELTRRSGLYDLLEPHDSVMADRGFLIHDDLEERGVALNIPPLLKGRPQLSVGDEIETRRIAKLRVHVERVIRSVKTFRILSSIFPNSMADKLDKIWKICCLLNNFTNEPLLER